MFVRRTAVKTALQLASAIVILPACDGSFIDELLSRLPCLLDARAPDDLETYFSEVLECACQPEVREYEKECGEEEEGEEEEEDACEAETSTDVDRSLSPEEAICVFVDGILRDREGKLVAAAASCLCDVIFVEALKD